MAANKFATMIHDRTNKITLILVYALLEWILIVLLLLNSLFSYLIVRFADYFGLQRPCLWCSRVDHVLDPQNSKGLYKELVCESHAREISELGYCSNHRKLAESQNMCADCSQSSPGGSNRITFMIREGDEKKVGENCEVDLKCSCCDVGLEMGSKYFYSPCFLINPNWGVLDYAQKTNLITEGGIDGGMKEGAFSEHSRSDFGIDPREEGPGIEENFSGSELLLDFDGREGRIREKEEEGSSSSVSDEKEDKIIEKEIEPLRKEPLAHVSMDDLFSDDASHEILPQHLEYYIDNDVLRLIPVGLVDSRTAEEGDETKLLVEGEGRFDLQEALANSELQEDDHIEFVLKDKCDSGEAMAVVSAVEPPQIAVLESKASIEIQNPSISVAEGGDFIMEMFKEVAIPQATQNFPKDDHYCDNDGHNDEARGAAAAADGDINSDDHLASEEVFQTRTDGTEAVILIGTESPDQERITEDQTQDGIASSSYVGEDPSTSSSMLCAANDDHDSKQVEQDIAECKTISIETSHQTLSNHVSFSPDHHEIEVGKLPDTPKSEKREWGAEESLDGSIVSEYEAGEGVLPTMESLKSALSAKRNALNTLYEELEQERNASAVAASQTMAMINRLQEEKAAMQMEALQYQRVMEEQSEYDQEALQLLNELMVKRERENQELEKELELYRKKVMDFEAKEKMMMLKRVRTSTASCSNAEDSDGLSIDLNTEGKEEESFYSHQESGNHNTPVDAVLNLDESFSNFEDERLCILDQLRILEEKLFSLADEEEQPLVDMKRSDQFCEENGEGFELNGVANGFPKEINGKHQHNGRIMGANAKRLLPLFDAVTADAEDGIMNGNEEGFDSYVSQPFQATRFEMEAKKLAIEEEVDRLYERLNALEADGEFLKHCVGSLKKGGKGMDLLREILQHLRDLRNVELRAKNGTDGPLV